MRPLYLLSLLLTFMFIVLTPVGYALQRIGKSSLIDQSTVPAHFCSQCGLPVESERDQHLLVRLSRLLAAVRRAAEDEERAVARMCPIGVCDEQMGQLVDYHRREEQRAGDGAEHPLCAW